MNPETTEALNTMTTLVNMNLALTLKERIRVLTPGTKHAWGPRGTVICAPPFATLVSDDSRSVMRVQMDFAAMGEGIRDGVLKVYTDADEAFHAIEVAIASADEGDVTTEFFLVQETAQRRGRAVIVWNLYRVEDVSHADWPHHMDVLVWAAYGAQEVLS